MEENKNAATIITNKKLVADSVKVTVSKFISLFVSTLAGILLVRIRTVEEFGTYSQLLLVIDLSTTIIMMGLPNAINYFLARAESENEKKTFLSNYYTISTVLSVVLGVLLMLFIPVWQGYFHNPAISRYAYFLLLFPGTKIICGSVENLLIIYGKTSLMLVYRTVNSFARLGIIVFVWAFSWTFDAYMIMYVGIEIGFTAWVYVIAINVSKGLKIQIDFSLLKKILSFSLPIGLATVVGTLNTEIDKLLIGGMMSTEDLAVYTNAAREMPITIIATSITAVLLPQITRLLKDKKYSKAVSLWGESIIASYSIVCFFVAALVAFAPDVITLLYSEKYLAGVTVFRIYSLILLLRCTYWGMILNASGKTKFILYSAIGSLAINVVLNIVFFYSIGFAGPAIASVIAQFTINIVQLYYTTKIINVRFSRILPWKEMGLTTLVNLLMAIAFVAVKYLCKLDLIIGSLCESMIIGIIWIIIYYVLFFQKKMRKLNTVKEINYD